jgi:rubrerythrin
MKPMNSLDEILNFAIGEEQAAAAFYTSLATQAPGLDTRQALLEFAREEQGHEARLKSLKAHGVAPVPGPAVPNLRIADYLVEMKPGPDTPYRDLLMLAMQKELAAFRMYTDLAALAGGSARDTFTQLAQEEARHKLKFETEYDNLMKEG